MMMALSKRCIDSEVTTTWIPSKKGKQWAIIDGKERHFSQSLAINNGKIKPKRLPYEECARLWQEVTGEKMEMIERMTHNLRLFD